MGFLENAVDKTYAQGYNTLDVCESVGMVDKHV